MSQLSVPVFDGPCRLKTWFGSSGGVMLFQIAVVMIHACTSMPAPCAAVMIAWSGSYGRGAIAAWVRGMLALLQKQSPRRPTCTTRALMLAACAAATSLLTSVWLKIPSPNASTHHARNSLVVAAALETPKGCSRTRTSRTMMPRRIGLPPTSPSPSPPARKHSPGVGLAALHPPPGHDWALRRRPSTPVLLVPFRLIACLCAR